MRKSIDEQALEFCREVLAGLEVAFDVEIVLPSSIGADVQAERSKVSSLEQISRTAGLPAEIIWVYAICLIASIALLLAAIYILAKKVIIRSRRSSADAESNMLPVICLLIGACFFGALPLGFHESLLATDNPLSAVLLGAPFGVYDCLTMLLFEGRLDSFYGLIFGLGETYSGFASGYLLYVTCLYVIAPIAIAATAISMFKGRVYLLRAITLAKRQADRGRVYIFEGVNDRSLAFVKNLKKKADKYGGFELPLVIFTCVSKDDEEKQSGEIRDLACKNVRFIDSSAETLLAEVFRALRGKPFKSLHVFFFGDDQGSDLGATISFLRNMAVWTSCFDEGENDPAAIEKRLREIDRDVKEGVKGARNLRFTDDGVPRYHVYCACSGRSDEPTLDSMRGIKGIDVRIIDEGREAIYDLLWNNPMHKTLPPHYLLEELDEQQCKKASLVVVILGLGEYGFEAFRSIFWLGQIVDVELNIFVIDQMAEGDFEDKVDYWCPELRSSKYLSPSNDFAEDSDGRQQTYTYYQATVGKRDFNATLKMVHEKIVAISKRSSETGLGRVSPYCVVALGEDDLSTDAAISMRQVFCGDGEDADGLLEPLVYVNIFDHSRHAVIEKMNGTKLPMSLIPFGSIERIFTESYIVDSPLEALAFAVHGAFRERKDGETESDVRIERYLDYTEWQMNRLSSAANALAIRSKLWALGLDMETHEEGECFDKQDWGLLADAIERLREPYEEALDNDSDYSINEFLSSGHQLCRMARAEHDRWVALYLTEGWTSMSPKASLHFRFRGMNNGRHDSHLLMRHPFIVPFDELSEISKRVGKDDARLNDVKAVIGLEDMLSGAIGYGEKKRTVSIVRDSDPGLYVVSRAVGGAGGVYEKKPGTSGFHAFATDEPGLLFHNILEDGTEESPGVFMCGLLGEVWRIEKLPKGMSMAQLKGEHYPEKLNERYVIDGNNSEDGKGIRYQDLKTLPEPIGWRAQGFESVEDALRSYTSWSYDFSGCTSLRYRKPEDGKPKAFDGREKDYPESQYILAVPADSNWTDRYVQGSYTEYWVNRENNVWDKRLEHGSGDWIACALVECSEKARPRNTPIWEIEDTMGKRRFFCPDIFIVDKSKGKKGRPYVINGVVFEQTYQMVSEARIEVATSNRSLSEKKTDV